MMNGSNALQAVLCRVGDLTAAANVLLHVELHFQQHPLCELMIICPMR